MWSATARIKCNTSCNLCIILGIICCIEYVPALFFYIQSKCGDMVAIIMGFNLLVTELVCITSDCACVFDRVLLCILVYTGCCIVLDTGLPAMFLLYVDHMFILFYLNILYNNRVGISKSYWLILLMLWNRILYRICLCLVLVINMSVHYSLISWHPWPGAAHTKGTSWRQCMAVLFGFFN